MRFIITPDKIEYWNYWGHVITLDHTASTINAVYRIVNYYAMSTQLFENRQEFKL